VRENQAPKLRNLTVAELQVKQRQLREDLFNSQFRNAVQQLDNPLRIRAVRRDIARIETVLSEHARGIRSVAAQEKP
jgi:large subunit ribosomal protein L29